MKTKPDLPLALRPLLLYSWLAMFLLLAAGCNTIKGDRFTGTTPTQHGEFLAGVAKVDITPLPGYPMGGHSIAATVGRGVWTRLHATAIYLQDPSGGKLAIVSCDLWGMPAGLADRVAELVAKDPRGIAIGRESVIIAATHTHQSPGNFSSSPAYNILASPLPWFDRDLFNFFSARIASAVLQAISTAEPARLSFLQQTNFVPVARNRSMPAFILDPECRVTLDENSWIPEVKPTEEYPDPKASRAVDPRLRVLRIEARAGRLMGLAGFMAMHPTTMSHETEVYTADVFGVAETEAEQTLRDDGETNAVVTLFNGPEGDISPLWYAQDRATSLKLGRRIAQALVKCKTGGIPAAGNIKSLFAVTSIAGRKFPDETGRQRMTSEFAEGGAALVAGAEDGRTIFNYDGHVEGTRYTITRTLGEGAKLDMFALGFPIDLPKGIKKIPAKLLGVPTSVPLGVSQFGDILFATLPGEFTTTMGKRIESALLKDNPGLKHVILIGLANEYLSYFTTPEEYDSQQYEGASTLYGPAAGPFVRNQLLQLARDLQTGRNPLFPMKYRYNAGPGTSFIPPKKNNVLYNSDDGLGNILEDTADHLPYRNFPSIAWNDPWNALVAKMKAGEPPIPQVWVEFQRPDGSWTPLQLHGRAEENTGLDFVTTAAVSEGRQLTWTAFWMPPRGIDTAAEYRLSVRASDGLMRHFQFKLPPDCPFSP